MDASKRTPLIIAALVWLLLIVTPILHFAPVLRLLLIVGIPIAGAFYARSTNAKRDHDMAGVFEPAPRCRVADASSVRVGHPTEGVTSLDVTSARTRWPVAIVIVATVIFGIPTLINASEKDGGGLMALCIGIWVVVILGTWARVAGWSKRRGPMGGRFDVGPDGIQIYAGGAASLVKRSDIHLVEIFNGWTNQSATSVQTMGVFMGTGAAGMAAGAAYGGVAGTAAIAGASVAKAERWNADHAYQVRYRVSGKAYPLVGGLSLATAQEVFWHLTGENPTSH